MSSYKQKDPSVVVEFSIFFLFPSLFYQSCLVKRIVNAGNLTGEVIFVKEGDEEVIIIIIETFKCGTFMGSQSKSSHLMFVQQLCISVV